MPTTYPRSMATRAYRWAWQSYREIPDPLTTVAVWPSVYFAHLGTY